MAPELLNSSEVDPLVTSFASDVYSLAIVFYEVCALATTSIMLFKTDDSFPQVFTGFFPFNELRHSFAVVSSVLNGGIPTRPPGAIEFGLTDTIWRLMEKCWATDPEQRPNLNFVSNAIGDTYDGLDFYTGWRWPRNLLDAVNHSEAENFACLCVTSWKNFVISRFSSNPTRQKALSPSRKEFNPRTNRSQCFPLTITSEQRSCETSGLRLFCDTLSLAMLHPWKMALSCGGTCASCKARNILIMRISLKTLPSPSLCNTG